VYGSAQELVGTVADLAFQITPLVKNRPVRLLSMNELTMNLAIERVDDG
jgi:hypothetical protein